ncbi:MAG: hypothetical protein F4Y02_08905 [Chloroflexi bacterium]|nr:hypothetical protein [Chloroflexota bacterium]
MSHAIVMIASVKPESLVGEFARRLNDGYIEIYNEFSLQHEFGIFLREKNVAKLIQFERNVSYFQFPRSSFTKKEIDITCFDTSRIQLRLAVELKYPRAGQFPEQMFSFCKDIAFLEELKMAGFSSCLFLAVVEQRPFHSGRADGIYRYFRGGEPLHGKIVKPTGAKDQEVLIEGKYVIRWKELRDGRRYTWIEANPDT